MSRRIGNVMSCLVATLVLLSVAVAEARTRLQPGEAASPSDALPKKMVQGPIQAPIKAPIQAPACDACCKPVCIKYLHHCTVRKTCCGCDTIKSVLCVTDPCCCGKTVEVPVCLPCDCTDTPKICDRCTILGRSSVTYKWCCGYKVKVVFDRCGNVTVHSYGR